MGSSPTPPRQVELKEPPDRRPLSLSIDDAMTDSQIVKNPFKKMNNHLEESEDLMKVSGLFFKQSPIILFNYCQSISSKNNKFRRRKNSRTLSSLNFIRLFSILLLLINFTSMIAFGQQYKQEAYFDDPQPLVYNNMLLSGGSHESGSGDGRLAVNQFSLNSQDFSSSSSSVSPSLITAKCWNNYENDNDCKHINVITASNANDLQQQQQRQHQNQPLSVDDDSIITPIVIFESSSTLEPNSAAEAAADTGAAQAPPAFLAPPYFSTSSSSSSSPRPDGNVPLQRHRTPPPPTANDVYAAPPAGATHLPPPYWQSQQTTTTWPTTLSPDQDPVTRPTTSVFVATPAPKKPLHKTTTMGRKCRDENDEDCDEPEETEEGNDGDDANASSAIDDDNEDNDGSQRGGGGGLASSEGDKDNEEGDDERTAVASSGGGGTRGPAGGTSSSSSTTKAENPIREDELGSGNGPDDDNEDTEDDDDLDSESSGSSEPPSGGQQQQTGGRHLEVEPNYRPAGSGSKHPGQEVTTERQQQTKVGDDEQLSSTTQRSTSVAAEMPPPPPRTNAAEIEIVVHSTLPPTFIITSSPSTSSSGGGDSAVTRTGDLDADSYPQITSTTIMPDDTVTSRPVFPSTTSPAPGENGAPNNQAGGEAGFTTNSNSNLSTEPDDLFTFKPVPMPPVEPDIGGHRPSDFHNNQMGGLDNNNGSFVSAANKDEDPSKMDDKYKFDPNAIVTSAPQKFDSPWREKPPSRSTGGGGQSADSWSSPGSRFARPRTQDQQQQQQQQQQQVAAAGSQTSNKSGTKTQVEVLPALLVYASIVIIVATAIIFSLVAITFWRRNSARQQALLLHKSLNGHHQGPNGQMVGSMSHGSQMVANIQQPGLLSTYGPSKSLAMGKITTSIIKSPDDNNNNSPIAEEDEGLADDTSPKDSLAEGSLNDGDRMELIGNKPANSSWSTSESQTTSATATTSSGGSQKTTGSQQQVVRGGPAGNLQQPNGGGGGGRVHYSNSLSDERQNSSSISDSQCSPVDNGPPPQMGGQPQRKMQYSPPQAMGYPPQPQQHHHQSPYHANPYPDIHALPPQSATHQNYPPPHHHVTGYYNPQAVIHDSSNGSVERYRDSPRFMDHNNNNNNNGRINDPRYHPVMLQQQQPPHQPPYMMAPNQQILNNHQQQQQLMKPPISNCPPSTVNIMAQRGSHIYPPSSGSPASSYASSTLPRQPIMNNPQQQQEGPINDSYLINGMPRPRLGNGYMHRNTISMEFSNQFDAHV